MVRNRQTEKRRGREVGEAHEPIDNDAVVSHLVVARAGARPRGHHACAQSSDHGRSDPLHHPILYPTHTRRAVFTGRRNDLERRATPTVHHPTQSRWSSEPFHSMWWCWPGGPGVAQHRLCDNVLRQTRGRRSCTSCDSYRLCERKKGLSRDAGPAEEYAQTWERTEQTVDPIHG